MGHFALTATKVILDKFDISGDLNAVNIERSLNDLPDDNFVSALTGMKARIPGLQDGVFSMAGMVELTDDGQDEIFGRADSTSLTNVPITVGLGGLAAGARVKFGAIQQGEYKSGGNVGGRAEFSANGRISNYVLTDGNVLIPAAVRTGNGSGPGAVEVGQVLAGHYVYMCVHLLALTGVGDVTFGLDSDSAVGFPSPTRQTNQVFTVTGSRITAIAGAITDTWWNVSWACTATSFNAVVSVGIL